MTERIEMKPGRKQIAIRLLYTLFYMVVFELLKAIIQLCVVFQYIYMLITQKSSEPVRNFSNRVVTYTYTVMRYLTLGANQRPFPFSDFPKDMEPPVEHIDFS